MKSLAILELPLAYLLWHYTVAWGDLLRFCSNIAWFLLNFFSVKILLRTLFSPWKRLQEGGRGRGEGGILGRLIINTITRLVGALVRSVTILVGLAALLVFLFVSAVLFLLWPVLPLAAALLAFKGIVGLFMYAL